MFTKFICQNEISSIVYVYTWRSGLAVKAHVSQTGDPWFKSGQRLILKGLKLVL